MWQGRAIAGLVALAFALPCHIHNYQRPAFRRPVNLAQYRLLRSVESMPGRERLFVEAPYQSPGSYLPCVAGVVCNGWHVHHALLEEGHALYRNRTHTHRLVAAEGAWRLEPLTELASAEAAARR